MEPEPVIDHELKLELQGKQLIQQNYPIIIRISRKSFLKRKSQSHKSICF